SFALLEQWNSDEAAECGEHNKANGQNDSIHNSARNCLAGRHLSAHHFYLPGIDALDKTEHETAHKATERDTERDTDNDRDQSAYCTGHCAKDRTVAGRGRWGWAFYV